MKNKISSLLRISLLVVNVLISGASGDCPEPQSFDKFSPKNDTSANSYPEGTLILYQCIPGFASEQGVGKSYCQESGEWSTVELECKPISCGKPDAPEHGKIKGTIYSFGQTVSFECHDGFKLWSSDESRRLNTSPEIYCNAEGQWTGEIPKCLPFECPVLTDVENGKVEVRNREYGGRAIYTCNRGFKLQSGDLERRCQLDETWSGTEPVCQDVQCEDPEEASFLEKHPEIESCTVLTALEPGNQATCICKADKVQRTVTCKDDGEWEMPCKTGEETTLPPTSPSTLPPTETTLPDKADDETTVSVTVQHVSVETTKETVKPTDIKPTTPSASTGKDDETPIAEAPSDSKGLPSGVIVGLIFGVMALVIAAIILVVYLHRRKNSSKKSSVRKPNPNDAQNGIEMKSLNKKDDV